MNIGFIGFGNMARALAEGFVKAGVQPARIGACARDMEKLRRNTEPHDFRSFDTPAELVQFADVVFVAVKPYQVESVLTPVKEALKDKIVVSVAAGFTLERYETFLAPGTPVLCTVPNTPVAAGEGIVVCERRHSLSAEQFAQTEELLKGVGMVIAVDTPLLGIAGTICGCGPAFVSMFTEALADAAVKHGIARADAYRMVSQMIVGTGKLQQQTGLHPGEMKDAVCSPGGTTIVGVAELERRGLRGAVIDAVDAIERKK